MISRFVAGTLPKFEKINAFNRNHTIYLYEIPYFLPPRIESPTNGTSSPQK